MERTIDEKCGMVTESRIKILYRTDKRTSNGTAIYEQQCGICGSVFMDKFRKERKSCGCLQTSHRDHSGEVLSTGVKIIRKTNQMQENGNGSHAYLYQMLCPFCGTIFERTYNPSNPPVSCGCKHRKKWKHARDYSGMVLPSGIRVLSKTEGRIVCGETKTTQKPIYQMQCTCGAIFEHTYKYELKSCGDRKKHPPKKQKERRLIVNHSGEKLASGISIIERLEESKNYGGRSVPVYRQWCPFCHNIFEATYKRTRKSCGCLDGKDRTGEVLESGIRLLKRLPRQNRQGSYYYLQKCGRCGKEFESVYNPKLKSCGCIVQERDRSGETNPHGVLIIRKVGEREKGEKHRQNYFLYEMKCPICGKIFEQNYSEDRKSCGCIYTERCHSKEQKQLLMDARGKNHRFGTNLGLIASQHIPSTNTSGYKGVGCYHDVWYASICFQGYKQKIRCKSREEAIQIRQIMEESRNEFLKWYDGLSLEEKNFAAKQYEENKSYFRELYQKEFQKRWKVVRL